jgi:hypothetical protein
VSEHSIQKLINHALNNPVHWIIEGLWQEGGIAIVHSLEEEFKSVLAYQMGEAVAAGTPLLRLWDVPKSRRTGFFETEMDDLEMGRRLGIMYPHAGFPEQLVVSNEELLKEFRKRAKMNEKFECLDGWIRSQQLEILVWDTINSTLAAGGDPNSERTGSLFYDMVALLPLKGLLVVRHDIKPSKDTSQRGSNQLVRGTNRLVEEASLVLYLKRKTKASHMVRFEVGKLRNAPKPELMELWFDAGRFGLSLIPPVPALLESGSLTRQELLEQAESRFQLKKRTVDEHRTKLASFLVETMVGHQRVVALDYSAKPDPDSDVARWWPLLKRPETPPGEMQPCSSIGGTPMDEPLSQLGDATVSTQEDGSISGYSR